MESTKYLRRSVFLSQTFGVISFEIKKFNEKIIFTESEKRLKLAKINFGFVVVLHVALVVFSADEIKSSKDDLCVKIVRFVNLMAFTGGIIVMFLTITTKGKVICDGLNEISDLYFWSVSRAPNKKKTINDESLFLGIVANYLTTVFPLMLTALYVQRYKPPKVISYSYYAFSMWLENIFIYQFVTIARFAGEVYACVTRIPGRSCVSNSQLLWELRRSRSNEETVKNFIQVLINAYKYALFFWICWSFTMILQFVLKVNLRMRVVIWCFFISIRVIAIIYACSTIKNEVFKPFVLF